MVVLLMNYSLFATGSDPVRHAEQAGPNSCKNRSIGENGFVNKAQMTLLVLLKNGYLITGLLHEDLPAAFTVGTNDVRRDSCMQVFELTLPNKKLPDEPI